MMKSRFIFLVSLFLFSPLAMAFEDPSGFMPVLDRMFSEMSFRKAFHTGDQFGIIRTSCAALGKCSQTAARFSVLSVEGGVAQVATFIGSRTDPSRLSKNSEKQWREVNGNMARVVVRELESYGIRVTLTGLRETSVTVEVNGQLVTQPALELSLVGKGQVGPEQKQTLTLSAGFRGPGELVRRVMDDGLAGHVTIELKSCRF